MRFASDMQFVALALVPQYSVLHLETESNFSKL